MKRTGGKPAEIFRRLIVAQMIRPVVAGEQYTGLRLPVEPDRITQPRSKRRPACLAAALMQHQHPAAPVIERIARAQILVAAIALNTQTYIPPPVRTRPYRTAVMP